MTMHSHFENPKHETQPLAQSTVSRKLQREVDAIEAIGFGTQPWTGKDQGADVTLPVLDVNWLIAQPLLPYLVHTVPTHLLYRSLTEHGLEDSLEVLECVRGETLVRLLDYDLWQSNDYTSSFLSANEDLSAERFLQWVKLWNEISPDFAVERLLDLDEEVIFGCLTAACEIVPVGLNRQQEELTDDYWMTPDNKFGLKLKTPDEAAFEVVHGLVHSLYKKDVRLAQQVLAHSAMLIREEVIEDARRWRQGRLEDQGFLPSDEARHLLVRKSHKALEELVKIALKQHSALNAFEGAAPVGSAESPEGCATPAARDEDAVARIHDVVQKLNSDVLQQEIAAHLTQGDILRLTGHSVLQEDMLAEEEDLLQAFSEKIVDECQHLLMRLDAHNLKKKQRQDGQSSRLIDRVMFSLSDNDPQLALEMKARVARISNGVLAAFGVVQGSSDVGRILSALRGSLNLGLERALKHPERLGIDLALDDRSDETALHLLKLLGPETVFQIGWQTLQDLVEDAVQSVLSALPGQASRTFRIQLEDETQIELPVAQLLSAGRYLELRRWLQSILPDASISLRHVLLSTVNRLPLFPILLSEDVGVTHGRAELKPYESLQEIDLIKEFIESLPSILTAVSQEE